MVCAAERVEENVRPGMDHQGLRTGGQAWRIAQVQYRAAGSHAVVLQDTRGIELLPGQGNGFEVKGIRTGHYHAVLHAETRADALAHDASLAGEQDRVSQRTFVS